MTVCPACASRVLAVHFKGAKNAYLLQVDSKGSYQTWRMSRLIWVFALLGSGWFFTNRNILCKVNLVQKFLSLLMPMNTKHYWYSMSRSPTKPTKWPVRQVKHQIIQSIDPVWSESSLSAWRNLGSLAIHWVHSEDWSDRVNAQADLSIHLVHMSFCWFCWAETRITNKQTLWYGTVNSERILYPLPATRLKILIFSKHQSKKYWEKKKIS